MRWDSLELACWYVGGPLGHARYVLSSFVAILESNSGATMSNQDSSLSASASASNSALGGDWGNRVEGNMTSLYIFNSLSVNQQYRNRLLLMLFIAQKGCSRS